MADHKHMPIALGLSASSLDETLSADAIETALPEDARLSILERDQHCCQYCGFHSKQYQKIRPVDGNPKNLDTANWVTACIFCDQCFDIEKVADMRSGTLIWLPEISQTDLHHIARAIYVARITQGPLAEGARKAYDVLMQRRNAARDRIHTDDPFILATVMKDYISKRHYEASAKKLEGIRLLPLDRRIDKEGELEFNRFPQILAYWRSKDGPFGITPPNSWLKLYKETADLAA